MKLKPNWALFMWFVITQGCIGAGSMENVTYADWDWVMGVNVGGVINGLQTWLQKIKSSRSRGTYCQHGVDGWCADFRWIRGI